MAAPSQPVALSRFSGMLSSCANALFGAALYLDICAVSGGTSWLPHSGRTVAADGAGCGALQVRPPLS